MDQLVTYLELVSKRLLEKPRVLVVDDEDVIRAVFRRFLRRAGFVVDVADAAETAWQQIEASRYDLVLTDKNLPGESGIQLLAKIQASGRSTRSVLITGFPSGESVVEALNFGAQSYITKPLPDIPIVVERLHGIIDREASCLMHDSLMDYLADEDTRTRVGADIHAHEQYLADLDERVATLVSDASGSPEGMRAQLEAAGTAAEIGDPNQAVAVDRARPSPLVVIIDLHSADAGEVIRKLRNADQLLEVVAVAEAPNEDNTLEAVAAGAVDVVCSAELLCPRVAHHASHGRKRRAAMHLFAALYRTATTISDDLTQRLLVAVPPADREYVRRQAEAPS